MKARKKPVTIECVKLENEHQSIVDAVEFVFSIGMETNIIGTYATIADVQRNSGFHIPTLEGHMKASFGDYIIKGVNGQFYPCKPDIFAKTYDIVED